MSDKEVAEKLLKEFHELWIEKGKPDPISNAYLALNRAFFYTKGLEAGIKITSELYL